MVHVREDYERYRQAGGEVALVTMENVQQTARFRSRYRLPFSFLADPHQTGYRAYEIPRGTMSQIGGVAMWIPGVLSFFKYGAGMPMGDVRQLPATFVVDTQGILRFLNYANNSYTYPTPQDIVSAFDSCRPGA